MDTKIRRAALARDAGVLRIRRATRHPDGATRLIASALTVFADDVRDHLDRGPCPGSERAPILPLPSPTAEGLNGSVTSSRSRSRS